ncbi:DNA-3-methyladenine glycosylase [Corynebacterium sp.]|uniref:DNA-3-methyladenine glycosylase n=1 Tax=Corynebacterium sp. TaxID=1720 RepID=UPI0027B93B7F|nr:DNA-3-methyladenine glycosylase [Corynebacterium sp.]
MPAINFHDDADVVAPQLLGATLAFGPVAIQITEVEAYLHGVDEAAHSFRGKTASNAALWGPGGHMYVYISYGIHRCCNLVCGPDGTGQGCLLRAGRVIAGESQARSRRGDVGFPRLASGPGNIGKAFGFDTEHNHLPVDQVAQNWEDSQLVDESSSGGSHSVGVNAAADNGAEPTVAEAGSGATPHPRLYIRSEEPEWVAGPRIGISKNVDAPLRFWIPHDKTVTSPKRPPS